MPPHTELLILAAVTVLAMVGLMLVLRRWR